MELLGLTGGMCSGKDSWADFIAAEFNYTHRSTSNVAREYIAEHELGEPTRDLTRETATMLRETNGPDYLVRRAIDDAGETDFIVISGIYVVPEAVYLKHLGGNIINIVTQNDLRFERMSKRGRAGESDNYDEFQRLMTNDLNSTCGTDQRLADVIKMADYEIDGSVPIRDTEQCRKIAVGIFDAIRASQNV